MSKKVNIPNDLSDFMKKNPTANFNDYLEELMVQAFIKDVEEKSKDAEPFDLFKTKAMSKHIYKVSEQTVDVRNFTIETDKPLHDDCQDDILEAICMVSITKEGDEKTGTTNDGVNYKVTYVDTDYGDDGQIDWEYEEVSDE